MDCKEIDISAIPQRPRYGKWIDLFDPMPMQRAKVFECHDARTARGIAGNAQGSIRRGRRPYRICTKLIPGNDIVLLYMWKIKREV